MSVPGAVWGGSAALATGVFSALMSATVRGGIVLVLAAAVVRIWPRASAAQRHIVWAVACCSLLLLPIVPRILPAWRVGVVPAAIASWDMTDQHATAMGPDVAGRHTALGVMSRTASRRTTTRSPSDTLWFMLVIGGWGSGTLVVLGVLLESQRRMRQFVSEALPLADARMLDVLARASDTVQLARHVPVRLHASTVPMVCGVLRPVIVLPMSACAWGESRLHNVILHELAHVKRHDCLTQTAASLACALYWFNPLVWLAVRTLQAEQEQACDDAVLSAGSPPCAYATDLLELTQTFQQSIGGVLLPALPFARPSQLPSRLAAIVDRTRRRSVVSRWRALIVWGTGLGVVCPLMVLQPRQGDQELLVKWKPSGREAVASTRDHLGMQYQESARDDCTPIAVVSITVGIHTHRPCRAAPPPAITHDLHTPMEYKTMKRSTAAAMLTSAATAGLLAGTPMSSHAQGLPMSTDSSTWYKSLLVRVHETQSDATNLIVIVDGVRVFGTQSSPNPLDQLDPNNIETIEEFKGPSATAIYGSDAANGAIVITTKDSAKDFGTSNVSK